MMCPMADICELRDRPQRGNLERKAYENLLEEESTGTTENVSRDEESIFDTRREIKEIKAIPVKITILHTKKESIIVKAEEDPRKPWYFTRV